MPYKTQTPFARKLRAKKVLEKIVESGGNKSVGEAMIEVGYGVGTSKNPQVLTKSKIWQEVLEEYLPDDLLAKKHLELLNKLDEKGEVDVAATAKALDMAYKLKQKYIPAQTNIQVNNFVPLLGGDTKKSVSENNSNRENTHPEQEN